MDMMEKIARVEENSESPGAGPLNSSEVLVSQRDDRGNVSKMETHEKPEEQDSAVADAEAVAWAGARPVTVNDPQGLSLENARLIQGMNEGTLSASQIRIIAREDEREASGKYKDKFSWKKGGMRGGRGRRPSPNPTAEKGMRNFG